MPFCLRLWTLFPWQQCQIVFIFNLFAHNNVEIGPGIVHVGLHQNVGSMLLEALQL